MSEDWSFARTRHGQRLNLVALNVRFNDKSIAEVAAMTIDQAADYFNTIELTGRQADIARDALQEIRSRLSFLKKSDSPT